MSDDDLLAELMTELRVRRADVSRDGFVQGLTLGELMVLKRKWEHAAAERMRERCEAAANQCGFYGVAAMIMRLESEEPQ